MGSDKQINKQAIIRQHILIYSNAIVTANQTSGQKNEPRSTTAQIPYSVHHNELQ